VYKRGDYQWCLQLSTQNVHTLIGGEGMSYVVAHRPLIQLMDDDLVCLIGLMLLVDPSCQREFEHVVISQLGLSLYLMTQCQMKLRHLMTSLAQTLDYIEVAPRKFGQFARLHLGQQFDTLNQLLLKITEHKVLRSISVDR